MRFVSSLIATALLLPPSLTAQQQLPRIPADVRIPVLLKSFLTMKDSPRGTAVTMETTADVKGAKGVILIPKGAKIYGKVTKAEPWSKEKKDSAFSIVAERAEWKDHTAGLLAFIVGDVKVRNSMLTTGGGPISSVEVLERGQSPSTIQSPYKDFPIDPSARLRLAKEEDVASEIYSTQHSVQLDAGTTFTLKTVSSE